MRESLRQQLDGKSVLLVAPKFFGYEQALRSAMERNGATVDYWLDKPSNSVMTKALVRVRPGLMRARTRAYIRAMASSGRRYDIVLIIKGEAFDYVDIQTLRQAYSQARFVYYIWDSFRNYPHLVDLLPLFDRAYSFDPEECQTRSGLDHVPLFFVDKYRNLRQATPEIDLFSVVSVHSDRYDVIQRVKAAAPAGLTSYEYFFYPSRRAFIARKWFDKTFHAPPMREVHFTPLPEAELLHTLERSKVVIDVQHPGQTGLTMRTIEMIGARKKLITTNPSVIGYDFYRPENILVIKRSDPEIPADFLATPYTPLPSEIFEKYSVNGWIDRVLG